MLAYSLAAGALPLRPFWGELTLALTLALILALTLAFTDLLTDLADLLSYFLTHPGGHDCSNRAGPERSHGAGGA